VYRLNQQRSFATFLYRPYHIEFVVKAGLRQINYDL